MSTVNLLTQKNCHDEYKDYFYIQDMIHLFRCEDEEDEEFQMEDFDRRMKILKTKCKDKYQFIFTKNAFSNYFLKFGILKKNHNNGETQLLSNCIKAREKNPVSTTNAIYILKEMLQSSLKGLLWTKLSQG